MGKSKFPYNITLTTEPPKRTYTKEEIQEVIDKSISLVLDDLILNGHLKIGN